MPTDFHYLTVFVPEGPTEALEALTATRERDEFTLQQVQNAVQAAEWLRSRYGHEGFEGVTQAVDGLATLVRQLEDRELFISEEEMEFSNEDWLDDQLGILRGYLAELEQVASD